MCPGKADYALLELVRPLHYHRHIAVSHTITAMPATLEVESTLTDRYQTAPEIVRLTRAASPEGDDPVLAQFLGVLARDMASHPERLQTVDAGLVQRLHSLVGGIEIDLDAALPDDQE